VCYFGTLVLLITKHTPVLSGVFATMGCNCDKLKPVKNADKSRQDGPPSITDAQLYTVIDTWQILKINIANVGVQTFEG